MQRREQGRDLHRLSQAHLVSDDAADALRVELPEPLHARALVGEEAGPDWGRDAEPSLEDGIVGKGQRELGGEVVPLCSSCSAASCSSAPARGQQRLAPGPAGRGDAGRERVVVGVVKGPGLVGGVLESGGPFVFAVGGAEELVLFVLFFFLFLLLLNGLVIAVAVVVACFCGRGLVRVSGGVKVLVVAVVLLFFLLSLSFFPVVGVGRGGGGGGLFLPSCSTSRALLRFRCCCRRRRSTTALSSSRGRRRGRYGSSRSDSSSCSSAAAPHHRRRGGLVLLPDDGHRRRGRRGARGGPRRGRAARRLRLRLPRRSSLFVVIFVAFVVGNDEELSQVGPPRPLCRLGPVPVPAATTFPSSSSERAPGPPQPRVAAVHGPLPPGELRRVDEGRPALAGLDLGEARGHPLRRRGGGRGDVGLTGGDGGGPRSSRLLPLPAPLEPADGREGRQHPEANQAIPLRLDKSRSSSCCCSRCPRGRGRLRPPRLRGGPVGGGQGGLQGVVGLELEAGLLLLLLLLCCGKRRDGGRFCRSRRRRRRRRRLCSPLLLAVH